MVTMGAIRIKLTRAHADFFFDNHIYFTLKPLARERLRASMSGRLLRVVSVPDYVTVEPYCAFAVRGAWLHTMGAHSYTRSVLKEAMVGRFCSIGLGVSVLPPSHPLDRVSTSGFDYAGKYGIYGDYLKARGVAIPSRPHAMRRPPPVIGHDVFIGEGACIARGVTIGPGAVVGAKALVMRDVEPYAIVGGIPAVPKRYRFDDAMRERMLALKWWDYDPADFIDLDTRDPERFIGEFEERRAAGKIAEYRPRQIRLAEELARISDS